jgi:hypothetical protein
VKRGVTVRIRYHSRREKSRVGIAILI